MSSKSEQLAWRREKVIALKARGLNHSEIARELQVSRPAIVADVQFLRNQAKKAISEYITRDLPEQYVVCLSALNEILKWSFNIIQNTDDDKDRLDAMEMFKRTNFQKLELLTDANVLDDALNYVNRSKQQEESCSGKGFHGILGSS